MASPDMRHSERVERLTRELLERVPSLRSSRGYGGVVAMAERLAAGERVTVLERHPVSHLMRRYRISRSAAYRLLDAHATKVDGRYYLDHDSRLAIQEEVAVRGVRKLLLNLLIQGKLLKGVGPKSELAARRWLQRHWRPESERLTVIPPGEPLDLRDPRKLTEWARDVMPQVMPRQALPADKHGR